MELPCIRRLVTTGAGLLCGWLIGCTVPLVAGSVNAQTPSEIAGVQPCPAMSLDVPASHTAVGSAFYVAGWATDFAADTGTGVDAVHVWAFPNPGSGQAAVFLGAAWYGNARGDVGAAFGAAFVDSGFFLPISSLSPGTYRIVVYAHSTVTGTFNSVQTSDVTVEGPAMFVDAPAAGAVRSGTFVVSGWALDWSAAIGTGVDAINVWAIPASGGAPIFAGAGGYGVPRPDLAAILGSQFANVGFNTWVSLPNGTPNGDYDLVVFARSTITGTFSQSHSVRITVVNPPP